MNRAVDVLFITHMKLPRDAGSPEVYAPLRLNIGGYPAVVPLLRMMAGGMDQAAALKQLSEKAASMRVPPVLTPFYIQDFLLRRGLKCRCVPCLETGIDQMTSILSEGVHVVALSTTWIAGTEGGNLIREAAARIRELDSDVTIVAGGVGARKGLRARRLLQEGRLPDVGKKELADDYLLIDAARDSALDAILIGEAGEVELAELVRRVRAGKSFKDLPNIAFSNGSDFVITPESGQISDVDGEIVDWRNHVDGVSWAEAPIRTAVGCPFRCEFCDFAGLYSPRSRSMESLVEELKTLAEALPAPRRAFFTDDNVALNRQRLLNLTGALTDNNLGLSWRAFVRADAIDDEAADSMKASGCRECLLGIESGDPRILKNMNKRLDPERAVKSISLLDERGINTQCTFVVGFPGEDSRSIDRTVEFISALPSGASAGAIHRYYLFRFLVAPLCPVASPESRARFKLRGVGEEWSHATMNSKEAAEAVGEVFRRVRGPSHMYLELLPADWTAAATRSVLEVRDTLCKQGMDAVEDGLPSLLEAVRAAEAGGAKAG